MPPTFLLTLTAIKGNAQNQKPEWEIPVCTLILNITIFISIITPGKAK